MKRYAPDGSAVGGQIQVDDSNPRSGVRGVAAAAIDDANAGVFAVWVDYSSGTIHARRFSGP